MASDELEEQDHHTRRHLILLFCGLGCLALFWLLLRVVTPPDLAPMSEGTAAWLMTRLLVFVWALPLVAGTALLAGSLILRMRQAGWGWQARVETAVLTSIAGAASATTAIFILPHEWDAFRLFFSGMFLFLLAGTILILLPPLFRKIVLTCWIFFHFTGAFTVFASIDPPGGSAPWLAKHMWTLVYRPYLQFLYFTNAYHFYSPDPGPPALLWFSVRYDDGTRTWIKIPTRDKSPVGMHYQRLLALPEHTFAPTGRLAYTEDERIEVERRRLSDPEKYTFTISPERVWHKVYARRLAGSALRYQSEGVKGGLPIPLFSDVDVTFQYREPTEPSQKLIRSVARRVLATAPARPTGARPISVKCYRIVHQCLVPEELAQGKSAYQKQKYFGYFIGEFDAAGELLDETDPFLYWYLPILMVPKEYLELEGRPEINTRSLPTEGGVILDCLDLHAAGVFIPRPAGGKDRGPGGRGEERP